MPPSVTVQEFLIAALRRVTAFNADVQVAPACILWPGDLAALCVGWPDRCSEITRWLDTYLGYVAKDNDEL